jgi:regulator of replication initiation timing
MSQEFNQWVEAFRRANNGYLPSPLEVYEHLHATEITHLKQELARQSGKISAIEDQLITISKLIEQNAKLRMEITNLQSRVTIKLPWKTT